MPRIARVVIPGIPHHITQRGNRKLPTFFTTGDYERYQRCLSDACSQHKVEIWAYCLMTNHVHLIAVPKAEDGLRLALGEAHRRYTLTVNLRAGWRGHLWQGRFSSFPMDDSHLLAAARYIELNPVKAGMVEKPEDYLWSSAKAHMLGKDDLLVKASPLLEHIHEWKEFLQEGVDAVAELKLIKHERTGRPLGSPSFLRSIQQQSKVDFLLKKAGRKPKGGNEYGVPQFPIRVR